jgi:glycosyltransferase involved in cell wall biosynthesis
MARDLATHGDTFRYRVLGTAGQQRLPYSAAAVEPLYRGNGRSMSERMRVLLRLLKPDGCAIHHFFFAPNKRSCGMARLALRLNRKASVHTIASQPAPEDDLNGMMFADRVVCVSDATAIWLRSAGLDDVRVIRPAIQVPDEIPDAAQCRSQLQKDGISLPHDAFVFLYAGDLEFSDGADTFLKAALNLFEKRGDCHVVLACRPKTDQSRVVLTGLKEKVDQSDFASRVTFAGLVPHMPTLLGAVDAVVMPVDTLFAKVDIPYVLLEAMALAKPVIVSELPPLMELAGLGRGVSVVPVSNINATAQAMEVLAANPQTAQQQGERARVTVSAYFDPDDMVERYESIYRELI